MNRISQNKVGVGRRLKTRAEVNELENRYSTERTKAKSWLFGKTHKINKYLERLVEGKKREGTSKQH